MKTKTALAALALSAIALTGCSNSTEVASKAAPTKATEATSTPTAGETPTETAAPTLPALDALGTTGAAEEKTFGWKADGALITNEMQAFTMGAMANPELMSNLVDANVAVADLNLTDAARIYLTKSVEHATEVTNDTFTDNLPEGASLWKPAAVPVEVVKMTTVTAHNATYQGQKALLVDWTVTVINYADQRDAATDEWTTLGYKATRNMEVTLTENPVEGENASVWQVADWNTSKMVFKPVSAKVVAAAQNAGE